MRIGDLVRMSQYHYWGLGIVLDIDEDVAALVRWVDGSSAWRYIEDLEIL